MQILSLPRRKGKTATLIAMAVSHQPSVIVTFDATSRDIIKKKIIDYSNEFCNGVRPDVRVYLFYEVHNKLYGEPDLSIFIDDLDICLSEMLHRNRIVLATITTEP